MANETLKGIKTLIAQEYLLEFRQKSALSGVLLYVLVTIFLIYNAAVTISPQSWMIYFWVILLFAASNAVARSFIGISSGKQLYWYWALSPTQLFWAKMLYNTGLLAVLAVLTFSILSLVSINPVQEYTIFGAGLVLGVIGLSAVYTFVSALASKSGNGATLMVILSFPILIPMVSMLIRVSGYAIGLLSGDSVYNYLLLLLAVDVLTIALATILFPYLWQE